MSVPLEETLRIIDATLAEYSPLCDPEAIEEEERQSLHDLVAEGWCEAKEEELIWEWFKRK